MAKEAKPRASKKDTGTKAGKAKKDPNAPKRPLSAYMYFSQENRSTVKEENPDASFGACLTRLPVAIAELTLRARRVCKHAAFLPTGDLGKLLGAKWKEMDDEDKAVRFPPFACRLPLDATSIAHHVLTSAPRPPLQPFAKQASDDKVCTLTVALTPLLLSRLSARAPNSSLTPTLILQARYEKEKSAYDEEQAAPKKKAKKADSDEEEDAKDEEGSDDE